MKTTADAALFLAIADEIMGEGWAAPDTFRFGASGVLTDLLKTCGMAQSDTANTTGTY